MNFINIISILLIILLLLCLFYIVRNQVREYHEQSDPMLHVLREMLLPVHPLFKEIKLYSGKKSYTINKERIYICLKDENGEYYPLNMLTYVILHEISHMINTKDVGHTEEWQRIFDELLKKAENLGVYNPSIPTIRGYCGTD